MRHFTLLSAALWLCAGSAVAQKAGDPSALDKSTMEQYVRHLFVWGSQIQVNVADPKPAADLPGYKEVMVTATAGQASQEEIFFVSNDGQNGLSAAQSMTWQKSLRCRQRQVEDGYAAELWRYRCACGRCRI